MYSKCQFVPLVLPTIYDDTLSYEEHLSKVIYRMNELTQFVEQQLADVDGYVDKKVSELSSTLTTIVQNVVVETNKIVDDLDKKVEAYNKELSDKLTTTNEKVDKKYQDAITYVDTQVKIINASIKEIEIKLINAISEAEKRGTIYTNTQVELERVERTIAIQSLNKRIDNLSKEYPLVFDPISGQKETIDVVIKDLYNGLRVLGLSAIRYDSLELTAEEYDALELTAYMYDVYGASVFEEDLNTMFNPFTGVKENVKSVVLKICDLLRFNAKNATEYDSFQFTADEFDKSSYDAITQDIDRQYTYNPTDYLNNTFISNTLLWVGNEDNTPQNITIDSSYGRYLIKYKNFDGGYAFYEFGVDNVNRGIELISIDNSNGVVIYTRIIEVVENENEFTLNVGLCNVYDVASGTNTTNNSDNAIVEIYGVSEIKNVLNMPVKRESKPDTPQANKAVNFSNYYNMSVLEGSD